MIDYIEIAGFKSIKKMELELRPINILIGSNGSGKSNFISFFKLIKSIFNGRLQRYVIQENADNLLYFGRKTTNGITGKITFENIENSGKFYEFSLLQNSQHGLFIGYELVNINDYNNLNTGTYKYAYENVEESKIAKDDAKACKALQDDFSQIKIFHFNDTSNTSFLRKECDTNDNLYLKPDGRNLPAILYLIKENHPKVFARIEKTIQSVAPHIANLVLVPQEMKGRGSVIELRWSDTDDAESNFSAYHFSDGTLRFIALATLLMQPTLPQTIILDEPELGLHPQAIGRLAGLIQSASNSSQIIISTQSADLISDFTPEDIIAVDQRNGSSIFQRLNSADLEIWLQDYSLGELWQRNILNKAQPI